MRSSQLLPAIVCSAIAASAAAVEFDSNWIGGAGGLWSNAANWDTPAAPNNTVADIYNVFILDDPSPGPTVVSLDIVATINRLTLGAGAGLGVIGGNSLQVNTDITGINGALISTGAGSTVRNFGVLTDVRHASNGGTLANTGGTVSNVANDSGSLALENSTIAGRITNNDTLAMDGGSGLFNNALIDGSGRMIGAGADSFASYTAVNPASTLTFEGTQQLDGIRFFTLDGQVLLNGTLLSTNAATAEFGSDVIGAGLIDTAAGSTIATSRLLDGITHTGDATSLLVNAGGTVSNLTNLSGTLALIDSTIDGRITNNGTLLMDGLSGFFGTATINGTGRIAGAGGFDSQAAYTALDSSSTLTLEGIQLLDNIQLFTLGGQVLLNGTIDASNNSLAQLTSDVSGTGLIHTRTNSTVITDRLLEGVTHTGDATGLLVNQGGTVRNVINASGSLVLIDSRMDGTLTNNATLFVDGLDGSFDNATIAGAGRIIGGGNLDSHASYTATGAGSTLTFAGVQAMQGVQFSTLDGTVLVDGTLLVSDDSLVDMLSDVSGSGLIDTSSGSTFITRRLLQGITHTGDATGLLVNQGGTVRDIINDAGEVVMIDSRLDGRIENNATLTVDGLSGSFDNATITGAGRIIGGGEFDSHASFTATGAGSTLTFAGVQAMQGVQFSTLDGQILLDGTLLVSDGAVLDLLTDVSGFGLIETNTGATVLAKRLLQEVTHTGDAAGLLVSQGGTVRNIINDTGRVGLIDSRLDGRVTNNAILSMDGLHGSFDNVVIDGGGTITGVPAGSAAYTATAVTSTLTFEGTQRLDNLELATLDGRVIINGTLHTRNQTRIDFTSDVTGGVVHTEAGTEVVTKRLLENVTHTATGSGVLFNQGGIVRDVTNNSGVLGLADSQLQGVVTNNATIVAGNAAQQVIVGPGATLTNNGAVQGSVVLESGGMLNGSGRIDVDLRNTSGTLSPGNGPGTAQLGRDFIQLTDGIFAVEIGGYLQGVEYDWLDVGGGAQLGGALDVSLFDFGGGLFEPALGDTFDILSADTIGGEFDMLTSALLGNGLKWDVSYIFDDFGPDLVRLTVSEVPVPAAVWLFGSGFLGLIGLARRGGTERTGPRR